MTAIVEVQQNMLVVPATDSTTLADIRPIVEQFVEINKQTVFDYRSKSGNKAARSHVAMLRKVKAPINDTHKRQTEEAKRFKDAADKDRRELVAMVDEMINIHAEPLERIAEEEKAEAERVRIEQEIIDCWDIAHDMNIMVDQRRELDRQAAEQARIAAEQEAEQRRLQIEKEKKEAADKAAEEARLAEQARAARAIEEAKQREQSAREEADRRVREAEELAVREKAAAEARAIAEAEQKRKSEEEAQADYENIVRVHLAILTELVTGHGIEEEKARELILAMRAGTIPAVSIDYQWQ